MSFYSFPPWQLWNFVFLYAFMWLHCWGSPSAGWKIISRHRILQKGLSLLRIKSRDKVGTVSTVGRLPDRPRRADSFYGLIANSYGLKTKKIPAGRQWHPTPVLLPRESHGWRSLVGCSPWGRSLGVGHDWATSLSLFTFMHWRRKWQPTSVFLPGESQGRGSLVGCRLWGRTESGTTEAT